MRKNVKQQLALRVLSTAALMAMVSSIATAAFAAEYNVKDGSVEIVAKDGVQSITQWADKDEGTYVTDDKGAIKDREDSNITLTTKDETTGETETTSNTVTITAEEKGDTANVTLKDVDIESSSKWSSDPAPIEIKGNGNTNLELNGNNTVFSGNKDHAGIEKADVNGTGTLTIKDDVNDDSSEKTGTEADTTGKLVAGGFYNGAAIGGGGTDDTASTSNIRITGGDITASGGYYGAGIGAGCYGDASNIRIEGNAHVTAFSDGSAAIGSGYHARGNSDITITDHATVEAASLDSCAIGSGHDSSDKVTITISGNASVNAQTRNSPAAIGSDESSATVNIEDHADVTAVGYGVAIGTGYGRDSNEYHGATSTVINITGGTVNAVTRGRDSKPAIGTVYGNLDLTINSSTGKTTVNAYTTSSDSLPLIGTADHYDSSTHKYDSISPSEGAEYNEDGSSNLGEDNAAIINSYRNTTLSTGIYNAPETLDDSAFHPTLEFQGTIYRPKRILSGKGDLTKVVHNRKYMEENPNIDITKLEDEDLHDWKLVGKVVEPTTEKDGYADYICSIDKCGQTKHVVLPKIVPDTPSTPDTPNTPDKPSTPDTPSTPDVPSTPEVTPADPAVTPDAPAQDGTAPADTPATDTTAAVQNVAQNAEPEAAAAAPAAAAVLPQTGANWLAVVGTALSGMFLLAAGFVLDRKNRRMN